MPRKKKSPELSFFEQMRRLQKAGLYHGGVLKVSENDIPFQNLNQRIDHVLKLLKKAPLKKPGDMICFIMYDIEHNKVRNHIAKYLLRKGCTRVQKSVFLVQLDRKKYEEMHKTLKEVQEMYDNNDSIFFLPVTENELASLKLIGKNIDFEVVTERRNTLFI